MSTPYVSHFPTWTTVTVGTLGNTTTACNQLKKAHIKIGRFGGDILERTTFEYNEATLDLTRVSVKELGLKNGATTVEIYAAAEHHGLILCPHEVGPQLWLQHLDLLPCGERLLVAMEPIADSVGDPSVFCLGRAYNGCRWLGAEVDYFNCIDEDHWVFVRSK